MLSLRARLLTPLVVRLATRVEPDLDAIRRRIGPPAPEGVRPRGTEIAEVVVAGVPGERYLPTAGVTSDGVLVTVHGGAYVAGSPADSRRCATRVGRDLGVEVLSVDYRLAPEHPFPAGPEDVAAVLREVGARGVPWLVQGESAGGGVLLSALQMLHATGDRMPDGVVLLWPSTDLTATLPSFRSNVGRDVLTPAPLLLAVEAYLAGHDPLDPLASPLHADLDWLPPVLVQVGDRDLLLDDSRELATRLTAAGVDCRLEVWPGMVHAFGSIGGWCPEARRSVEQAVAFCRERLTAAGRVR